MTSANHDDFDYEMIAEHAKLVVDTRGVFKRDTPNVVHKHKQNFSSEETLLCKPLKLKR